MTLLDEEKNKIKIDDRALKAMTKQIVLAERDNMKKFNHTKNEMVKIISDIIEKTLKKTGEENAD